MCCVSVCVVVLCVVCLQSSVKAQVKKLRAPRPLKFQDKRTRAARNSNQQHEQTEK